MSVCIRGGAVFEGCFERERRFEEWRSPSEIVHLGAMPFYQAVACWSLLLGRAVTVSDVSQEFHVTERRASDVLHYITHDASDVIVSESRIINCPQGRRIAVRVFSVQSRLFFRPGKTPHSEMGIFRKGRGKIGNGRKCRELHRSEAVLALRAWFVSRRQGERAPEVVPAESTDIGATRMFPDSGE